MSEDVFGFHSSGEILAPVGKGWDIAKHPTIHPATENPPGQTVRAEAENAGAAGEDPVQGPEGLTQGRPDTSWDSLKVRDDSSKGHCSAGRPKRPHWAICDPLLLPSF